MFWIIIYPFLINSLYRKVKAIYLFIYLYGCSPFCFNHRFIFALHLCFCIDLVPKSVIFLLYRLFIENKYRYIKLTAVIIFTAIFNAFCTSFGFVLRAENNDCLVALLAFVFAFKTKAVVCSSACFGIYEKIPFLFCFLW